MVTITFTVPDVITSKVRGKELSVDLTKAVNLTGMAEKLFIYGFNRKWNDAAPMGETLGKTATDEEKAAFYARCHANAVEMVKDWLAGDFETERSGGGRTANPLKVEIRAQALARFESTFKREYVAKDEWCKAALEQLMAHPTIIARAEKTLAERNEDLAIDIPIPAPAK